MPENTQRAQGEERQQLLIRESVAVDEHRGVPSAEKLVDARKILIAHVKEIAASGNAEAIIEMEKDFIQNDLEHYARADDKEMIGSLNASLLGVSAIKQQLALVDDLPAAGRLEETEKQFVRERGKALSIAEQDYIARQAKTLGVALPQRAKPAQANSDQGRLSVREAAKRNTLERAYTSLPRAEAVQAYPELADVYKLEAAVKGFADENIPNSEAQKMFLEAIRQKSFNELAKGNPLPQASISQTPQPSQQDLDPER